MTPTTGVRRARLDRIWHPDDRANVAEVMTQLKAIRISYGIRAISSLAEASPNPQVSTMQAIAGHVGLVLTLTVDGLPGDGDPLVDLWCDAALTATNPMVADHADRQATLARLIAGWRNVPTPMSRSELCALMDVTDAVITRRMRQADPMVSTWQIWARALGGSLTVGVEGEIL